jgi:hypothetical protein
LRTHAVPARKRSSALEEVATCPVCDEQLPMFGPGGVVVHLLEMHPESSERGWALTLLGVFELGVSELEATG